MFVGYIYFTCLFFLFMMSLMSIIFISNSILGVLISMEGMVLSCFFLILSVFSGESVVEIFLFLVAVVGESVLGLILLILKVGVSGCDTLSFYNVV